MSIPQELNYRFKAAPEEEEELIDDKIAVDELDKHAIIVNNFGTLNITI